MTSARPRIALIHALENSVLPARQAFARHWPEANIFDLLDTSLAIDLAQRGRLDEAMMERFASLADYASESEGTQGKTAGVLFTCSAFAQAIDAVKDRLNIPVLRPNEAAFAEALERGSTIGLVVSFTPSQTSLTLELEDMAEKAGKNTRIESVYAAGALEALKTGDVATHDRLVVEASKKLAGVDVIVLGQFSMARALASVRTQVDALVLTTPDSGVQALRRAVT